MQNKPNFLNALTHVKFSMTRDYENKFNPTLGENKPNTNPIKANKMQKMGVKAKNKPKTNPIKLVLSSVE
jgi:hypothetical protein